MTVVEREKWVAFWVSTDPFDVRTDCSAEAWFEVDKSLRREILDLSTGDKRDSR